MKIVIKKLEVEFIVYYFLFLLKIFIMLGLIEMHIYIYFCIKIHYNIIFVFSIWHLNHFEF